MRAIIVTQHGGPEVLKLGEAESPSPGPRQVVVRIHAAGVNPVDTYIRSGVYNNATLPYTPGFDGAGVVEAVGLEVGLFKVGDRVYTSGSATGTYAEMALCDEGTVHRLPDNIDFRQGAAINIPYATAHRALFQKARATAAEIVLIHGATGGVGTAAVQWAAAAGLKVIGTAGSDAGLQRVLANGATAAVDHRKPGYAAEILALTGGAGVDVILEMLANVNLGMDLTMLAKWGRVVVIGSRGKVEILPRDLMSRDATIMGMTLFNAPKADLAAAHNAIHAGLRDGVLRPVVGREFPLAEAPAAHVAVLEPAAHGKIVIIP